MPAPIANADVQYGRLVSENPSGGILAAIVAAAIVNILSHDPVTGLMTMHVPPGTTGGAQRLALDGRLEITRGAATSFFTFGPTVLGLEIAAESALTSSFNLAAAVTMTQTVATVGSVQGFEALIRLTHTSGTVALALGLIGNIFVTGLGGTTTKAVAVQGGGQVTGAGVIVTNFMSIVAASPGVAGGAVITNLYGFYCSDLTLGTNNFPLELVNALRVDKDATGGNTRLMVWDVTAGALRRVKVKAAATGPSGADQMLYL